MKCSIVIPHKDRLDHLVWTLRALKLQVTQYQFEVIVVDDGSDVLPQDGIDPDDLPANTRFINQNNNGAGSARNAGWMASSLDIIIFLDCDQIVFTGFVENHMAAFEHNAASFVQLGTRRHLKPKYEVDLEQLKEAPCSPDERVFFFQRTSFNLNNLESAWHLGFSHNISMRRDDLVRFGGFDEAFVGWGFEDCELCYRLKRAGLPLVLNPTIEACHQAHNQRMTIEKFQRWLENLTYFMQIHPDAQVDIQKVLIPACDPLHQPYIHWSKALLQMEALSRLGAGRPLQERPVEDILCHTLEDLQTIAASKTCAQTRAQVSPSDVHLLVAAQLDPALQEVRIFFP